MGKASKITLPYRYGRLPERMDDILASADENDLKILIALQMAADKDGVVDPIPDLGASLGLSKAEVDASLKFWRGAGWVTNGRKTAEKGKTEEEKTPKASTQTATQTAHRNGAVVQGGLVDYTTAELADLLEQRRALADFVTEAQRVLGKTINYHDTGIIVGLIDQFGFEEEAVLAILAYAVRLKKATARNAEKIALVLYDEGMTTANEVVSWIEMREKASELISQIRTVFGIGSRALSNNEKTLFNKWIVTYAFDIDVIRMAYDIMIDNAKGYAPKYMEAILGKWYTEGLRTARDIEEFEKARKATNGKGDLSKSYDVDDFFEASLKRSYEELDKDLQSVK